MQLARTRFWQKYDPRRIGMNNDLPQGPQLFGLAVRHFESRQLAQEFINSKDHNCASIGGSLIFADGDSSGAIHPTRVTVFEMISAQ